MANSSRPDLAIDSRTTLSKTNEACVDISIDPSSVLVSDREADVTGGGVGIGRGLAAYGVSVVVWEQDADTCSSAADEIGGFGITSDVREPDEVDAALAGPSTNWVEWIS